MSQHSGSEDHEDAVAPSGDAPRRRGRARRGRGASGGEGGAQTLRQLPWGQSRALWPPVEPLSADQLEAIHRASLRILEEVGVELLSPRAERILLEAGAERSRAGDGALTLAPELVEALVAKAPGGFDLHARNPEHRLRFGETWLAFSAVGGPPNVHDSVRGRRGGNFQDYCDLTRLAQVFNAVELLGSAICSPIDLPANTRHLESVQANLTLCDKPFYLVAIGAGRVRDGVEMAAIARGVPVEHLAQEPMVMTTISVNSPRRFDEAMAEGLLAMVAYGQPVVITPFTLMGAMTPVTLAGALVQQNAEALFGVALAQAARPGAPVMYGAFTSNVDLRSGSPAFGTPENTLANLAAGQLARRYGLPYRSSNVNASNAVDAQAAYESMMGIWGAVMGGANLVYHGAGWLEGGLTASYEKFVLDVELIQHMKRVLQPIDTSEDALAVAAIEAVPSGGHFFGEPHTMERYRTAFYEPLLSDWRNHGAWSEAGAPDAAQRATGIWQRALAEYEEPRLPADRLEALDAYVARRREEIGADEP